jgi:hypothetical protein
MDRETDIIFYCLMSRKVMAQTGQIRCAMDHILEAERKGEINHDNVLYIVENINVAGNSSVSSTFFIYRICAQFSQLFTTKYIRV